MKKTQFILLVCGLLTQTIKAQNWLLGGNIAAGPNGTTPFSNIFGTQLSNNTAIRFQTTGADRMYMNPNITNVINGLPAIPRNGFLGLGQPIFFMPPPRSAGFVILRNA